jgi:hypothetical protein
LDEELRGVYARHARVQIDYSKQLDGEYGKLLGDGSVTGKSVLRGNTNTGGGHQDADVMMI